MYFIFISTYASSSTHPGLCLRAWTQCEAQDGRGLPRNSFLKNGTLQFVKYSSFQYFTNLKWEICIRGTSPFKPMNSWCCIMWQWNSPEKKSKRCAKTVVFWATGRPARRPGGRQDAPSHGGWKDANIVRWWSNVYRTRTSTRKGTLNCDIESGFFHLSVCLYDPLRVEAHCEAGWTR